MLIVCLDAPVGHGPAGHLFLNILTFFTYCTWSVVLFDLVL